MNTKLRIGEIHALLSADAVESVMNKDMDLFTKCMTMAATADKTCRSNPVNPGEVAHPVVLEQFEEIVKILREKYNVTPPFHALLSRRKMEQVPSFPVTEDSFLDENITDSDFPPPLLE